MNGKRDAAPFASFAHDDDGLVGGCGAAFHAHRFRTIHGKKKHRVREVASDPFHPEFVVEAAVDFKLGGHPQIQPVPGPAAADMLESAVVRKQSPQEFCDGANLLSILCHFSSLLYANELKIVGSNSRTA
jgi:hypothetical protein